MASHHLTETYPCERELVSGKYASRDELVASVSTIALDFPSKIITVSSVCVQLKLRNATIILAKEMCRGELPHGKEAPNHQDH